MKRMWLLAVFAALPGVAYADVSAHRYLVATRHAVHGTIVRDAADAPRGENVRIFEHLDGYAADLTDSEVAALRQSGTVLYVEPVVARHAFDVDPEALNVNAQTTPYGIDLVHAPPTWPVVTGRNINVVVIDTGIDYRHPELSAIYAGGLNTLTNSDDALDDNGHGTHCAGTIAAKNNSEGVVGVAPDVRLWAVKVLDNTGTGSSENVVAALDWVIGKKNALGGDWIVSLSLGSDESSNFEANAFARATGNGILPIAASGNESTATKTAAVAYPAAYPGVMSVGAIDASDNIATFSNQGPGLSVVAPGVSVLSTLPVGSASVGMVTTPKKENLTTLPLMGSKRGSVTAPYVYCGLGRVQDFTSAVVGKIALIKRGEIFFSDKTKNAVNAGAIAVVIFNYDNSSISFTLINTESDRTFPWPVALSITQTDGEALAASTTGGTMTVASIADDYGTKSGTSMSTPHVAGVAALVWSADPNASAEAVRNAIEQTAHDLGSAGRDSVYGFGLVDAFAAAKQLAPGRFSSGASPEPPVSTGRTILRRGH